MTTTNNDNKEVLLEIRDLRIAGHSDDRWHEIVKGIDLTLHRGEILGLIGESGAGKSTLGLAAMGYCKDGCKITGGEILFDDKDLAQCNEEELRKLRGVRIAYVAQSAAASFNPSHRLIDQHVEAALQHGVSDKSKVRAEAVELYRSLNMPDPENIGERYPHQVSGGQLQRAMTAMAMACHPDIIVFDEPTTALDVTTQIEVLASIRAVVEKFGTAALYISHDLAVVAQMADRIMVLRHGELVEEAETRTMLATPKETYTQSLWAVRLFSTTQKPHPEAEVPLVEVRDVSAGYGAKQILENVSFSVYKGQTVAVIGESGSGKSTTARVISGLLAPSTGSVLYNGEELPGDYRKRPREMLRKVQMIYQIPDTAINPRQTIGNIIGRPMKFYHGLKDEVVRRKVKELLALVELDPDKYIDRRPSELSGGQKQRICIARALAAEPDFIICDEVTSALDQLVAEGILKLLNRVQESFGVSYLFITHDVATVRAIADQIVVMQHGKVVDSGTREAIFSPPHQAYTDLLLSSEPEMDPDWLDGILDRRAMLTSS